MLQFILIYFIWHSIYQSTTILSHVRLPILRRRYPKGIDNPLYTSGCEKLLFVCRCYLRCVAWFSYWFDSLVFISEENTYYRCAASSFPLWGNTDVVLVDIKRNFWRHCRGGSSQAPGHMPISSVVAGETSSTSTRFLIKNLISLQFTLFAICLSFSSPPLHKTLSFYSPSFSFVFFSSSIFRLLVLPCVFYLLASSLAKILLIWILIHLLIFQKIRL